MQRNVPQFIEIEDKIFGPFTLKQFAFLAGGAGLSVIIWRSVPFSLAIILIGPVMGFFIALAFAKFNSKPFLDIVRAGIYFLFSKKRYIWQNPSNKESTKRFQQIEKDQEQKVINEKVLTKNFNKDDIKNLAKNLNKK
jgi:hypothetical protein